MPDGALTGQVAVVTGGTRGLGKEFARALAAAGASVAVLSRNQAECDAVAVELADNGTAAVGVEADVTDRAQLERGVELIEETLGPMDVLINNAGIALKKDALDVSFEEWSHVLSVNLDGVWNCSQIFGRGMVARGHGSIINIGSMFGLVASVPVPDAGYVASKSAVNGLTRELANQWGTDGVRVNAIAPGWFLTEMTTELFEDEKTQRWLARQLPLGRPGQIDELDGVLLFLASDASSYCTGQVIAIDGGYTIR